MAEEQTAAEPAAIPLENTAEAAKLQWQNAERALAALEGKAGKEPPAPPPEPEKTPTEPAPAEKDDEEPAAAKDDTEKDANPKVQQLHELAKELGLKVDARGVTKEERYGFRQEKRDWQAKSQKREADFQARLQATQQYFAPLHPAVELIQAGDWDGAVKKLAEFAKDDEVAREGLNGATKRYLKRAAGEDPRVDELSRKLARREAEEAERAQQAQLAWEQQEQQRIREEFTRAKASELTQLEDVYVQRLAKLPKYAPMVVAHMEQNWDGYETVSLAEAAEAVARQARATYDELHQVFGDPDPSIRETSDESLKAGRSGIATVGKKAPKALNARTASEASPPSRSTDAKAWREKWAAKLAASSD